MNKFLLLSAVATGTFISSFAAIPSGFSVVPANNSTVETITEIKVSKNNEYYMDPYINRSIKVNGEAIKVDQKATNNGGTMVMTLSTPVTKSGTYTIVVPEGMFTYGFMEDDNPEMSWTVIVNNPNESETPEVTYAITPAEGTTLKGLDSLSINFADASAVKVNSGATAKVTVNGNTFATTQNFNITGNTAEVTFNPAVNISGSATVTIAESAFSVTIDGKEVLSPEIKATYNITAPLAVGDKFVVDKIKYKVTSTDPKEAEVTWPDNEDDYAPLTTVPLSVSYDGDTYSVTAIGSLAFSEVKGIKEFTVPEGIVRIGDAAFWESSLTSISIPTSVTTIGESAFDTCESLESFTLPASVTTLGSDILFGCTSLKEITLPEGMKEIPANFVRGCSALEDMKVPSTVTHIGEFAMSECELLTTTNIPDGVTAIDRFAYAYCVNLKSLPIPETVSTLGHGVFYQAGIEEASLPEAITVIPDGTFQCCANLTEFTIGNNVTEIEKEAFYWCFALENITFGEKVATIGDKAFYGDDNLLNVKCLNPVPATGASFSEAAYANATLIVPEGAEEAYRNAPGWKEFSTIKQMTGVSSITDEAADVRYFNLQGLEITQPENGQVVIVRKGNKTERILFAR